MRPIRNQANRVAVHHAAQMRQRNSHVVRQNMLRQQMMNRQLLSQLVQEVVEVGPTAEDLQRFIDIISLDVEDPGLEFAQVETEIRETTPFAGVLRFLSSSQNRSELATYLELLLVIVQTVILLTQQPVVVVTPEQEERIIERVIEHFDSMPEPPPTTQPDCP